MKLIVAFAILLCLGCKSGSMSEDSDYEYKVSAHKFIRLIWEEKVDSVRGMILLYQDDSSSLNRDIFLIKGLLQQSKGVPNAQTFSRDTISMNGSGSRYYLARLFRDMDSTKKQNFVGTIKIGLVEGMPSTISLVSVILSSGRSKF